MHYTVASTCHHELSYSLKPVGYTITVSKTRELCDSRESFEATGEWVSDKAKYLAHVVDVGDSQSSRRSCWRRPGRASKKMTTTGKTFPRKKTPASRKKTRSCNA